MTEEKVSRRSYVKYAGAGIVVVAGAAAGAYYASQPKAPAEEKPKEKVSITHVLMTGEMHEKVVEHYAPEFEEKTGIHVELVSLEWQTLHDKLMMDFGAKAGAYDVINFDGWWTAEMLGGGFFAPTSELTGYDWYDAEYFDWNDFVKRNVDYYCAWKGVVHGVPAISDIILLWYRNDLMQKYGVTPPPRPPGYWTWDQFLAAAEALNHPEEGIYGFAPIVRRGGINTMQYMVIIDSLGGCLLTEDLRPGFNNEAGRKAFEIYKKYCEYAPPGYPEFETEEALGSFYQGQTAMTLAPQWVGMQKEDPTVSKVVGKVDSAIVPGGQTALGGWALHVNKFSKHHEEAWKWIYFLKSKEMDKRSIMDGFQVPVRISTFEDPEVTAKYPHLEIIYKGLPSASLSGLFTSIPESHELYDFTSITISEVVSGIKDIDTGLTELEDNYLKLLKEKGYIS